MFHSFFFGGVGGMGGKGKGFMADIVDLEQEIIL